MVDHDDQNKNPEHEPSQKQLKELYGRLFGIATRHRNTRVDEYMATEGPRELPPHVARAGDAVAHSYSVSMSWQELVLCGIEDIDHLDIIYADPRMLDDEPADGVTLLYIQSGTTEEIVDVSYDVARHEYSVLYDVRQIDPSVGDDAEVFRTELAEKTPAELEELLVSLELDIRPFDDSAMTRVKRILSSIEQGFAIY